MARAKTREGSRFSDIGLVMVLASLCFAASCAREKAPTQDPEEMVRKTQGFVEEPPPVVDTSTAEWKKVKEFVAASSIPRPPWLFVACSVEGEEDRGVLFLVWLQLAGPLPEVKGLRVRLDRASPDEYYEFPFYPGETGIGQIGYVWIMQVPYDIASGEGVRGRVIRDVICGKVPLLTFSRETAAAGMWLSVVDLDGNESNAVRVSECRRRSRKGENPDLSGAR